jgi:hypothetical protein
MSKDNKMDPFPYDLHKNLPVLRQTEQALISRVQVIMKCYRLKDGGFGYQGHVMNFEQDPGHIFNSLPMDFRDLTIYGIWVTLVTQPLVLYCTRKLT